MGTKASGVNDKKDNEGVSKGERKNRRNRCTSKLETKVNRYVFCPCYGESSENFDMKEVIKGKSFSYRKLRIMPR